MRITKKLALILAAVFSVNLMLVSLSLASTGKITVDTVRVRKAPTTDSNILRNLDLGDEVEVVSKEGDWYQIKYDDGKEGYIYAEYVELADETTDEDSEKTTDDNKGNNENSENEIKLEKNTKIYILPVLISSTIEEVQEETTVEVIETINNWACVTYNDVKGWIFTKNLDIEIPEVQQEPEEENNDIPETGYVNVASAYVRDSASKDGKVIDSLILNHKVEILDLENDWYKIKLEDGEGYIFAELVSDQKTAEVTSRSLSKPRTSNTTTTTNSNEKVIKTAYVSGSKVNVRKTASTSASIITSLSKKTKIEVIGESGNWYKIKTSKGNGYISKDYVVDSLDQIKETTKQESISTTITSGDASDIVSYAKQFLGCRYVYGGSGPSSFDCSGFTQYIFKHFGVSLPHNAVTQARYGKYVSKSDLQPGDLVIFNNSSNTSIGHAGIYIGSGKFIHAANPSRGVTTDTLNSGYYLKRFVEGRRLV